MTRKDDRPSLSRRVFPGGMWHATRWVRCSTERRCRACRCRPRRGEVALAFPGVHAATLHAIPAEQPWPMLHFAGAVDVIVVSG